MAAVLSIAAVIRILLSAQLADGINRGMRLNKGQPPDAGLLTEETEFELVKAISKFPEETLDVARGMKKNVWGTSFTSNKITAFGYNLANLFSRFYDTCPVLKADDDVRAARLALVEAFSLTMASCLRLLGIPVVERM